MNPVILKSGLTLSLAVGNFPAVLLGSAYIAQPSSLAIMLISDDGIGEPLATASVYVEAITPLLEPDEFVCKNYSENIGMDNWLTDEGLATDTEKRCVVGRTCCPILRLSPELFAILSEART